MKLRPWCPSDCRLIYDWRMDASIRRWSFNQAEFAYSDHEQWFARFLADNKRLGYILEDSQQAVAQIRFDPAEMPFCYRVSVAAAPGLSKKGYGSLILQLACASERLRGLANLLVAETMVDNFPSQKVFARNGFFVAGKACRGVHNLLCWALPMASDNDPVAVQLFAEKTIQDELQKTLMLTGQGYLSDGSSRLKFFFDAATCPLESPGEVIFHFNTCAGQLLLDLAVGFSEKLTLPLVFDNPQMAVIQICAAFKALSGHGLC